MPPPSLSIDTAAPIARPRSGSVTSLYDDEDFAGSPPDNLSEAELCRIREDVATLTGAAVRLLAVDADLTLFRVHTGGKWRGTPEGLSRHIRPLFLALIPEALAAGLLVAIVTFSPQARLIHEAIMVAMPDVDVSDMIVRGGQRQIVCENGDLADPAVCEGARKQKHIASVLDCLCARGTRLQPDEIVLVDDDLFNVEEARDHGMRGALFNLDSTAKLPRPRRRGSVMEMESAAKLEESIETVPSIQAMRRARSMPLEEAPVGQYCRSAEGM